MSANGQSDLSGWVIAFVGGRTLLGELHDSGGELDLSPVYDLQAGCTMTDRGIASICLAFPLLGFSSVRRCPCPDDMIHVSELHPEEQKRLQQAIANCEQLITQMRAQQSGIAIAPAGTKLPPIVGR